MEERKMNNVDKDIEQFEQNLLAINEMKNQIFELKNSSLGCHST